MKINANTKKKPEKRREKLNYDNGTFAVVKFINKNSKSFDCIPQLWFINEEKNACYWPPKSGKSITLRAMNQELPDWDWEIWECELVSEGHATYSIGYCVVREKCSQLYNTSSADEHLRADKFRREHPGLIDKSFENMFATSKDNKKSKEENQKKLDESKDSEKIIPLDDTESGTVPNSQNSVLNREGSESSETRNQSQMLSPTGSKNNLELTDLPSLSNHPRSGSENHSISEKSCHSGSISTVATRLGRNVRPPSDKRVRSRSRSHISLGSIQRSNSRTGSKTRNSNRSRIGSNSRSSNHSRSKSGLRSTSHHSRPISLSSSGSSSSSRRRSRSSSRHRTHSRSRRKTRSRSRRKTRSRSRRKTRSRSRRSTSRSISRNRSRLSSGSNSSSFWIRTKVGLSRKPRNQQKRGSGNRSQDTKPTGIGQRPRKNFNSRQNIRSSPPSRRREHHLIPSVNESHKGTETQYFPQPNVLAKTLIKDVNQLNNTVNKNHRRFIENDRRLARMEVTVNKTFILLGDLTNAFNTRMSFGNLSRVVTLPRGFHMPRLPIKRQKELTNLNRDFKDKEFLSFLINHEKDFCTPSSSTDNVTMTAYLKRFISLPVRASLVLKDLKGQSGLTLYADFNRVYLFLIEVMKAGYLVRNKVLTNNDVHATLRVVWGRSKQLLNEENNKLERR